MSSTLSKGPGGPGWTGDRESLLPAPSVRYGSCPLRVGRVLSGHLDTRVCPHVHIHTCARTRYDYTQDMGWMFAHTSTCARPSGTVYLARRVRYRVAIKWVSPLSFLYEQTKRVTRRGRGVSTNREPLINDSPVYSLMCLCSKTFIHDLQR